MDSSTSYREQLNRLGWVVIPNIIDTQLGSALRKMLGTSKQIAWNSNHKFPQRTYMTKLAEKPLQPFMDLQALDLANKIMGGDGWRFSPWDNTSCLVPAPPGMLYWCREHRDFLDDSKPHHPLDLWLSEFNNPLCFWRANLNLSPEADDYLWVESGSHAWVNLVEEKERALRPRFVPESQNSGSDETIRQFAAEVKNSPQLEQIVVPPFGIVIMRSTMVHRGGLYRYKGSRIGNKATEFGRMALHFAVENDTHCRVRKTIADETTLCEKAGIRWTERNRVELEKLSIFPSQLKVTQDIV